MLLPDVNVLLHALRADSPDHEKASAWLDDIHRGNEPIALCSPVLAGLLRIATHNRVYAMPTPRTVVWRSSRRCSRRPCTGSSRLVHATPLSSGS